MNILKSSTMIICNNNKINAYFVKIKYYYIINLIVSTQLLNAGEDVLVFYNDNKASFQQFVDMMRNERDRQYQEDMQILSGAKLNEFKKEAGTESQSDQQLTNGDFQNSIGTVTAKDSLTQDGMTIEGAYENNNDHSALRFVHSYI